MYTYHYQPQHSGPIRELQVTIAEDGIREIDWSVTRTSDKLSDMPKQITRVVDAMVTELQEYFAGRRTRFNVPLAPVGTPFQLAAWNILREIPYGSTVSYEEQARRMGNTKLTRAVGGANGKNPLSILVPCHRVIGKNGKLTGFGGGLPIKSYLLELETSVLAQQTHG